MIYAITPNPTLDVSGTVDKLVPNEKSYVQQEIRSPGGNAINAARIIKSLKVPVIASGFLGGATGAEVETLLNLENIQHQFINIRANTRINVTVSDRKTHLQTRLSFPGPRIRLEEKNGLFQFLSRMGSRSLLVIGGSLPPGVSGSDIAKMIRIAKKLEVPTVVDSPGDILKTVTSVGPIMIKPNLLEFQALAGSSPSSIEAVLREAKQFSKSIPLICISSVEKGAMLVTPKSAWFGTIPKIQIKTTVGAGDSMVGAMSAFLCQEHLSLKGLTNWNRLSPKFESDLLRWGLASAAATLSLPGLALGRTRLIHSFLPKINICQIA
jgi:1-phosphofructokinase family hexose kinase